MWKQGKINDFDFYIKQYEVGSIYGIDGGRISKLSIHKGNKELYNYDRGLDFDDLDAEGKEIYSEILKQYN